MVFTSVVNYIRARGPDEFWRKRKILRLAAAYKGRPRNCYGLAIRSVHRALAYATKGRQLLKEDMANLWETRITAGCEEHGVSYPTFRESLSRSNIMLNRKVLSDLACWEPYTFKALTDVAKRKAQDDGLLGITRTENLNGIIRRGALK